MASWKIASAVGHSTIYAALARMTFDVLEQDDTLSQVTLPILNMAATALDAYAEAVAERVRLHGWTQQLHEWDAVHTEVVGGIAFHVERILAHEESG